MGWRMMEGLELVSFEMILPPRQRPAPALWKPSGRPATVILPWRRKKWRKAKKISLPVTRPMPA